MWGIDRSIWLGSVGIVYVAGAVGSGRFQIMNTSHFRLSAYFHVQSFTCYREFVVPVVPGLVASTRYGPVENEAFDKFTCGTLEPASGP